MGQNDTAVAEIIARFQGQELDAHYLAFFECFNQGLYFEAHEVLEKIWLPRRKEANGLFYKGLIQLAGALVHLQKNRLRPAAALFDLALANLRRYTPTYEGLDVKNIIGMVGPWRRQLEESGFTQNPLHCKAPLQIGLV
jgi:predicted metal-dependent hydrolase